MIRALVLSALLAVEAGAQSYVYYMNGGMTNSSVTIDLPQTPPTASQVVIRLDHRARFLHGWETDFQTTPGVGGGCDWSAYVSMRQGYDVWTGGHKIASNRVMNVYARAGNCVPFDGLYDWMGPSGGNSSLIVRPTFVQVQIPVSELGYDITVSTQGRSETDLSVSCQLEIPITGGWGLGVVGWMNQSTWEADLTVSYE